MRIVELIIDEKDEQSGIDAISVVMSPAIESNFIHLSKHEVVLKEVDAEKRILMGAALIPNKQIYRKNDKTKDEYYIYFSEASGPQAYRRRKLLLRKAAPTAIPIYIPMTNHNPTPMVSVAPTHHATVAVVLPAYNEESRLRQPSGPSMRSCSMHRFG
jgi:hypothetical protein